MLPGIIPVQNRYLNLQKSVTLASASSQRFSRASFGTRTNNKIATFACWFKKTTTGTDQNIAGDYDGSSTFAVHIQTTTAGFVRIFFGGASAFECTTTNAFNDTTTWHHVCVAWDTTQATAANRVFIYVDGALQALSTANYPTLNAGDQLFINGGNSKIGSAYEGSFPLNAKLADMYFIDGQQLTPGRFTNGVGGAHPVPYTGTFGTNGFHLRFDASDGTDSSGNAWTWTLVNTPTFTTDVPI